MSDDPVAKQADPAVTAWSAWQEAKRQRKEFLTLDAPDDDGPVSAEQVYQLHMAIFDVRAASLDGMVAKIDAVAAMMSSFEDLVDDERGRALASILADLRGQGATHPTPSLAQHQSRTGPLVVVVKGLPTCT